MTTAANDNFSYCGKLLRATRAKVRANNRKRSFTVTVRDDIVVEFVPSQAMGRGMWRLLDRIDQRSGLHQFLAYIDAHAPKAPTAQQAA